MSPPPGGHASNALLLIEQAEKLIDENTKAIMIMHYGGYVADPKAWRRLADRHNIFLIEDAAHSPCAPEVGLHSHMSAFSFFSNKNMTTGEGGIITTNDDEVARMCRIIRSHGQEQRYKHDYFGLNWRMQDLNAAIGLAQMDFIEDWNRARIANAEKLSSLIRSVETPRVREGDRHVFHQYTIRVTGDRDAFQAKLQEAGIGSAVHYPIPIHHQPIMEQMGFGDFDCPVADAASERVLSIPVHPSLGPEDVEYIASVINRIA